MAHMIYVGDNLNLSTVLPAFNLELDSADFYLNYFLIYTYYKNRLLTKAIDILIVKTSRKLTSGFGWCKILIKTKQQATGKTAEPS